MEVYFVTYGLIRQHGVEYQNGYYSLEKKLQIYKAKQIGENREEIHGNYYKQNSGGKNCDRKSKGAGENVLRKELKRKRHERKQKDGVEAKGQTKD